MMQDASFPRVYTPLQIGQFISVIIDSATELQTSFKLHWAGYQGESRVMRVLQHSVT